MVYLDIRVYPETTLNPDVVVCTDFGEYPKVGTYS